jgi:hypothetical protein
MHMARSSFTFLTALALATSAVAQTAFPEIEPNGDKTLATTVDGIVAGDFITGTSTGTNTTSGSTIAASVDVFRVRTAPLPLGLYEHLLNI